MRLTGLVPGVIAAFFDKIKAVLGMNVEAHAVFVTIASMHLLRWLPDLEVLNMSGYRHNIESDCADSRSFSLPLSQLVVSQPDGHNRSCGLHGLVLWRFDIPSTALVKDFEVWETTQFLCF